MLKRPERAHRVGGLPVNVRLVCGILARGHVRGGVRSDREDISRLGTEVCEASVFVEVWRIDVAGIVRVARNYERRNVFCRIARARRLNAVADVDLQLRDVRFIDFNDDRIDEPIERVSVVVCEDELSARPLVLAAIRVHVVLRKGTDRVRVGVHQDAGDQVGHRLLHTHRDVCRNNRRIAEESHVPIHLPVAPCEGYRGPVEAVLRPEDAVGALRRSPGDHVRAAARVFLALDIPVYGDFAATGEHHALEVVRRRFVVEKPPFRLERHRVEDRGAGTLPVDPFVAEDRQTGAPVAKVEILQRLRYVHAVGGGDEAVDCLAVVVDRFGLGRRRGATGDESAGRQVQAGGVRRAPRARGGRIVDVDRLRVRSLKIVLAPQRQRRGTAQQNREKMFGFHIVAPFVSYRCRVYRTHPRHRSSHRFPTEDLKQNCDAGM